MVRTADPARCSATGCGEPPPFGLASRRGKAVQAAAPGGAPGPSRVAGGLGEPQANFRPSENRRAHAPVAQWGRSPPPPPPFMLASAGGQPGSRSARPGPSPAPAGPNMASGSVQRPRCHVQPPKPVARRRKPASCACWRGAGAAEGWRIGRGRPARAAPYSASSGGRRRRGAGSRFGACWRRAVRHQQAADRPDDDGRVDEFIRRDVLNNQASLDIQEPDL